MAQTWRIAHPVPEGVGGSEVGGRVTEVCDGEITLGAPQHWPVQSRKDFGSI